MTDGDNWKVTYRQQLTIYEGVRSWKQPKNFLFAETVHNDIVDCQKSRYFLVDIEILKDFAHKSLQFQRNKQKENNVIKFLLSVIRGDKPNNVDFVDWVKDGNVLMK